MKLDRVCQILAQIAPLKLAENWDNVGLLIGDRQAETSRIMTCLTVTPGVVDEAIESRADLLVSHHPLPFKPMARITTDGPATEMVWRLCRAGIAVYSAHTAYDSAIGGINDQWCDALEMTKVSPLTSIEGLPVSSDEFGAGRRGELPSPTAAHDVLTAAARWSSATRPRMVGDPNRPIRRIGIACGSGGSFVAAARRGGCDALLTGEATFHACLEAENIGVALLMVGHYASERFAMISMASRLDSLLRDVVEGKPAPGVDEGADRWVRASQRDVDPIAVDRVDTNP